MSHFLDQNCPYLSQMPFKQYRNCLKQRKQENKGDKIGKQLEIIDYYFQKQLTQGIELQQNAQFMMIRAVHKCGMGQRMIILQNLRYDKTLKWWQNSIQVMDKCNNYLKIYNTDKIIYIYKYFLKKLSRYNQFPIKLAINPTNGIIKIRLTSLIHSPTFPISLKTFFAQVKNVIQETSLFLSKNQEILMQIYQYSNKQVCNKPKQLPHNIKKHMNKFGVVLSLGTPEEQAQIQFNHNQQLQTQSRTKILQKQMILKAEDKKLLQIYLECDQLWNSQLKQSQLQFNCLEKQQVKERVKMPGVTKCKNIYENNYILNSIKINKYLQVNPLPINQGGFTSIYLAQVQFWYVYSGNNEKVVAPVNNENFTPDKLLKKLMIIKREDRKERLSIRNRIQHQKNILHQIKCGNALFIPKYYISSNQNLFKQDLLSDFIMLPNLIQYVLANKLTLSLSSKIYILFTLVQSLRYLKFYRIVHLDLKPNNIMISRTMMVKIIDFGQSYHPSICPQVYAPGFTMPYSSPQSYYPSESFSEKNDIFSIGVISYQILYGRFPFFLYNEKTHSQIYKYKQYTDHWFYNPQELKNYGDNQVFPILQLIFGRCLDPNPARRPQLDWLCLILRECIDFYL